MSTLTRITWGRLQSPSSGAPVAPVGAIQALVGGEITATIDTGMTATVGGAEIVVAVTQNITATVSADGLTARLDETIVARL